MFTVLINDKKFCVEDGTPLKEVFSLYGVSLVDLKENAPIGRFLHVSDRSEAENVSSDRLVDRDMAIETDCVPPKEDLSFSTCSLAINVSDKWIDVCLTDGKVATTRSLLNPLLSVGDLAAQETAYDRKPAAVTELLLSPIVKKCRELLTLYDQDHAETTVVCASEFYLKIIFGLPQNTAMKDYTSWGGNKNLGLPTGAVRVLPAIGAFISGELFCASVSLPENTFLIDCENNLTLLYVGKENDTYTYMWGVDYSETSLLMIRAAMRVLKPVDARPIVYLYGENAYALEDMLTDEGLSYIHAEKDPSAPAKAAIPSFYSKLEKEKKRTSFHDLLKDENFQEEMNNIYLYANRPY